jgi:hypothetical protein
VDSHQQIVEREMLAAKDDDFSIEQEAVSGQLLNRLDDLGEVSSQRLTSLGLEYDLFAPPKRSAGMAATDFASWGGKGGLMGRSREGNTSVSSSAGIAPSWTRSGLFFCLLFPVRLGINLRCRQSFASTPGLSKDR